MKRLSISFTLTPEDYLSYAKKAEPALLAMRIKRMLIPFGIMMIAGFFIGLYLSILAFSFLMISCFAPMILNREYMKKQEKSKVILRPVILDFYDDHIVQTFLPDSNFKGTNEKHFALSAISAVIESEDYIYFLTRAANIISIPKRITDSEQFAALRNLIHSLFSDKYQKI